MWQIKSTQLAFGRSIKYLSLILTQIRLDSAEHSYNTIYTVLRRNRRHFVYPIK